VVMRKEVGGQGPHHPRRNRGDEGTATLVHKRFGRLDNLSSLRDATAGCFNRLAVSLQLVDRATRGDHRGGTQDVAY